MACRRCCASSTLGLVLLLLVFGGTVTAQSYTFSCQEAHGYDHYGSNATFSNVFINASTSYRFNCEYNSHKRIVSFRNCSMDEVPKKLFDTFTSLTNANLTNCGIQQISRYSLERTNSLQILDLSRNALTELRGFVFDGAIALVTLNLAHNNISTIDPSAFASLSALRVLYLQANRVRTLDGALFSQLTALRHIFLDNNELELLEGSPFAKNAQLENVLIQHNRLRVVDEMAFVTEANTTLRLVALKHNAITKLNLRLVRVQKILLGNNTLEEVYISRWITALYAEDNRISRILLDEPASMVIETLSLENNAIGSLDPINQLRSLRTLDLAGNALGPLSIDSFTRLTKLQSLRLERTGVSNLQHGTFARQEVLQWLDLSYNNLEKIDLDMLTSSTGLTSLYLDGNRLRSIDYAHLKKMFPALAELGLVENRWNCTFLVSVVRYCNEHLIKLIKGASTDDAANRTNVKGIYCYDEKNPIGHWNETVHHLLASNVSEAGALQAVLQNVLDDVQRFSDGHAEAANRTGQLEGSLADLTRRQLALEGALLDQRSALLDLRLSLLSNRTTNESLPVGTDELRRMIDSVNNLTLDKQKLSEQQLDLKLSKQSYRVDQVAETAKENADKLTVFGQRLEKWISNVLAPAGVGFLSSTEQRQQHQQQLTQEHSGGASTGLLVTLLVLVCLMLGVLVFIGFRSSRRAYSVDRRRYTNRDSSLTTIVDNDI